MATKADTRYIEAIGRRKTSTARVRLSKGGKANDITVNGKSVMEYFKTDRLVSVVEQAFTKGKIDAKYVVSAKVLGGGIHSQAEAIRHGISRCLVSENAEMRPKLKKEGLLKRDSRAKERRKFGLKKARKAPQWSKR